MIAATQGRIVHVPVTDPLGERVEGFYGLSGDEQSAFIEMAAASGLGWSSLRSVIPENHLVGHGRTYSSRAGRRR